MMMSGKTKEIKNLNGFTLYRSDNGIATTIEYNWPTSSGELGERRKMEVIDAAYRVSAVKFGTLNQDTAIDTISGVSGTVSASDTNTTVCGYVKAAYIEKTAKELCDIWMKWNTYVDSHGVVGVPAVAYCRELEIDSENGEWQLPNIVQLAMIAAVRDTLNSMDPTANSNTSNRILAPSFTWSSSEYDLNLCWSISSNGKLLSNFYYKYNTYGVVPIREL